MQRRGELLGHPRMHLRRTGSTNDHARELALAGAPHGTLVTASEQTAGRGRQGRGWWAPPGSSLLLSLVLRPGSPGCVPPIGDPSSRLLSLLAAVAVCDVVGEHARIKWPNDVVIERAQRDPASPDEREPALGKLAGILVEARPQEGWAVLGVGVNVAVRLRELPAHVRASAATLALGPNALEPTLKRLLAALERRLADPPATTLEAWRARDALRGREIAWTEGHGRAEGIDESGRLLVALSDGAPVVLDAGEVHLHTPR